MKYKIIIVFLIIGCSFILGRTNTFAEEIQLTEEEKTIDNLFSTKSISDRTNKATNAKLFQDDYENKIEEEKNFDEMIESKNKESIGGVIGGVIIATVGLAGGIYMASRNASE